VGNWEKDEDIKLKDAVQAHGGKNWGAIAALVPSRTITQCSSRWHNVLGLSIVRTNERTGKWAEDEDSKLTDAVQTHGGKDWSAIAALVPGRGERQCCNRWHKTLDPNIDRKSGRAGYWTEDEDIKLKDGVQTHGGKNWDAIVAMVPGRTRSQCYDRWTDTSHPNIDRVIERTHEWSNA
jgi:myb proto-oncogene protein